MHIYTNDMSIRRKKSPEGESTSVVKFCAALVVACAFIGFLTWRHAQYSQEIRELRNDLKVLESQRSELAVRLHNLNGDLEREMEGKKITELARNLKLGLRPPDPRQRIVRMDRKPDYRRTQTSSTQMVGTKK